MTATAHLGLPLIEAAQAQKHVTHNEALRILDAAIQIAVADRSRTTPPAAPAEGERHIVAAGAAGAWNGQAQAIATWQDGAWAFLAPKQGWCVWSVADDVLLVFDGARWRDLRDLRVSLDNAARLGVNTTAAAPNLLSVKSNAALFAAIDPADGGSGDVRVQLAKSGAGNTASVVFSDAYSGRAEFGLTGSDAFKLKVSADGANWVEALTIDPAGGGCALPRGLALTGVAAPPQLTADQNDYAPAGLGAAAVLQLWSDAARSLTGLAGGAEGRIVCVVNVGSQPLTLASDSAASAAANRFSLGGDVAISARQAALLRYDAAAARWFLIAGGVDRGAWTPYTPTVTPGGGSFGAVTATGAYKRIGKTVFLRVSIAVANIGSAVSYFYVTLPPGMTPAGHCILAANNLSTNVLMVASAAAGAGIIVFTRFDNLSIGVTSGQTVGATGSIELA
ncbi:DUF2793 domain-containing protein [Rhodopseudomonas palustris]|uniref:DUF2793 domain-containing protein n=1 Tax=Rhodopseudomonas palustris TaxID=1076 RepID=UPI0034E935AD